MVRELLIGKFQANLLGIWYKYNSMLQLYEVIHCNGGRTYYRWSLYDGTKTRLFKTYVELSTYMDAQAEND